MFHFDMSMQINKNSKTNQLKETIIFCFSTPCGVVWTVFVALSKVRGTATPFIFFPSKFNLSSSWDWDIRKHQKCGSGPSANAAWVTRTSVSSLKGSSSSLSAQECWICNRWTYFFLKINTDLGGSMSEAVNQKKIQDVRSYLHAACFLESMSHNHLNTFGSP